MGSEAQRAWGQNKNPIPLLSPGSGRGVYKAGSNDQRDEMARNLNLNFGAKILRPFWAYYYRSLLRKGRNRRKFLYFDNILYEE